MIHSAVAFDLAADRAGTSPEFVGNRPEAPAGTLEPGKLVSFNIGELAVPHGSTLGEGGHQGCRLADFSYNGVAFNWEIRVSASTQAPAIR